jgi:hypothetical protein
MFCRDVIWHGEPFFCLAAAASGSLSFLVIWHFVLPFPRSLLRKQKADLLRPSFLPSIASNSIPKASFCIIGFFSTFISHQPPRRDAAKHFAAKEQPAAESWLLC